MTDEADDRRKDDMRVLERLSKVEVKVDTNCQAVRRLDTKLSEQSIRGEERARMSDERMMEKMDELRQDLKDLKDLEMARKGKNAALAALGGGVIAIGALIVQAFGYWGQ